MLIKDYKTLFQITKRNKTRIDLDKKTAKQNDIMVQKQNIDNSKQAIL